MGDSTMDSHHAPLLGKSLSNIFSAVLVMATMAEANIGAIRSARFQKIENAIFRSAWKRVGVRGHSLAQERSCLAICKGEADCGGLFIQDNYCHLVAPSVTSLEVAVAMVSTPGVYSYAIVEQENFSMDHYAPLSSPGTGNTQSWTTTLSGGDQWEAAEGTYTLPPTTTIASSSSSSSSSSSTVATFPDPTT